MAVKSNYMTTQIKKLRKQKYPFKTLAVNDAFKIKKVDYNSMLTAYRQHNKNHEPIEITSEDLSSTQMLITRLK